MNLQGIIDLNLEFHSELQLVVYLTTPQLHYLASVLMLLLCCFRLREETVFSRKGLKKMTVCYLLSTKQQTNTVSNLLPNRMKHLEADDSCKNWSITKTKHIGLIYLSDYQKHEMKKCQLSHSQITFICSMTAQLRTQQDIDS